MNVKQEIITKVNDCGIKNDLCDLNHMNNLLGIKNNNEMAIF